MDMEKQFEAFMNEYNKKQFKGNKLFKFNYTKMLMSIITAVYVLTYITCMILFIGGNPVPYQLLEIIDKVFTIGWVAYFGKSGVENFVKIRKSKSPEESEYVSGYVEENNM